jgi:uncharacterized protein YdhG (YjbR/CyaY superfamily)
MTIDNYIAQCSPEAQAILQKIRKIVRKVAPEAEERISYQMPAFAQNGMLIYFAAFKNHIGIFPPVKGDAQFQKDAAAYRNPKGNFKFPLDSPVPYALIERIAKFRLKEHLEQKASAAKKRPGKSARSPKRISAAS